jgi:hypothetical protein
MATESTDDSNIAPAKPPEDEETLWAYARAARFRDGSPFLADDTLSGG